jgi:AraC family transcriptional regulator
MTELTATAESPRRHGPGGVSGATQTEREYGRLSSLSAESFAAERRLPSRRIGGSDGLGWESVLARAYDDPDTTEGFTTAPTPDLLVVINLGGTFTIESRRPGGWARAQYRPGSIGVTAPSGSATLRWHREQSEQRRSLHLFLSAELLRETAQALDKPGLVTGLPDALLVEDPVIRVTGVALWDAALQRADPLYADSLAQSLALHVLHGRMVRRTRAQPVGSRALTASALGHVVDYMHAHIDEPISLEELARVASISKYHFVRLFSTATGLTPHRYLVGLRMRHAAELIRASADTVQEISAACGYASPGQFARAFKRHHGCTPTQFRREVTR